MTILVTGAAGFIGSHTVDRLLADGYAVVGLDNLRTGKMENLAGALLSPRFRFEKADITEEKALDAAVEAARPSAIIHLAALVSVQESIRNPELNQLLNVTATERVIATARRHAVPRIVFASSAAVYGDPAELPLKETSPTRPISPYGEAKLHSEALLHAAADEGGPSAICLRYFNVYGPRQDPTSPYSGVISIFLRQFAAGEPISIYGDGRQTRDFIHVTDVARANVHAATQANIVCGAMNICTGRSVSINEVLGFVGRGGPSVSPVIYLASRTGDITHSRGDPGRAIANLGFASTIGAKDGLARPFLGDPRLTGRPTG